LEVSTPALTRRERDYFRAQLAIFAEGCGYFERTVMALRATP
jgi:hypothetical protein